MTHGNTSADRRTVHISRHCSNGTCVGVLRAHGGVEVVDTKNLQGPSLLVGAAAWTAFVLAVKIGEFDVPAT